MSFQGVAALCSSGHSGRYYEAELREGLCPDCVKRAAQMYLASHQSGTTPKFVFLWRVSDSQLNSSVAPTPLPEIIAPPQLPSAPAARFKQAVDAIPAASVPFGKGFINKRTPALPSFNQSDIAAEISNFSAAYPPLNPVFGDGNSGPSGKYTTRKSENMKTIVKNGLSVQTVGSKRVSKLHLIVKTYHLHFMDSVILTGAEGQLNTAWPLPDKESSRFKSLERAELKSHSVDCRLVDVLQEVFADARKVCHVINQVGVVPVVILRREKGLGKPYESHFQPQYIAFTNSALAWYTYPTSITKWTEEEHLRWVETRQAADIDCIKACFYKQNVYYSVGRILEKSSAVKGVTASASDFPDPIDAVDKLYENRVSFVESETEGNIVFDDSDSSSGSSITFQEVECKGKKRANSGSPKTKRKIHVQRVDNGVVVNEVIEVESEDENDFAYQQDDWHDEITKEEIEQQRVMLQDCNNTKLLTSPSLAASSSQIIKLSPSSADAVASMIAFSSGSRLDTGLSNSMDNSLDCIPTSPTLSTEHMREQRLRALESRQAPTLAPLAPLTPSSASTTVLSTSFNYFETIAVNALQAEEVIVESEFPDQDSVDKLAARFDCCEARRCRILTELRVDPFKLRVIELSYHEGTNNFESQFVETLARETFRQELLLRPSISWIQADIDLSDLKHVEWAGQTKKLFNSLLTRNEAFESNTGLFHLKVPKPGSRCMWKDTLERFGILTAVSILQSKAIVSFPSVISKSVLLYFFSAPQEFFTGDMLLEVYPGSRALLDSGTVGKKAYAEGSGSPLPVDADINSEIWKSFVCYTELVTKKLSVLKIAKEAFESVTGPDCLDLIPMLPHLYRTVQSADEFLTIFSPSSRPTAGHLQDLEQYEWAMSVFREWTVEQFGEAMHTLFGHQIFPVEESRKVHIKFQSRALDDGLEDIPRSKIGCCFGDLTLPSVSTRELMSINLLGILTGKDSGSLREVYL
ncbi:hypothetical protein BCR33DRAFT_790100 [Rhizoclosmatium globosum]|uniref:HECT domain-containing protein n=1 Tax=Rhizoclosmatium globosum TaxID=329046 RepID=A0A1Y2BPF7_9FUNG|nr:hypothetical protein BCR33DRAFT_790100 [Rhizoclosmatium globosum]|eukprot:ORY36633.1 hypothetical protein BCR33DRAFT_790100 [Rhizoclosmatium globosum]